MNNSRFVWSGFVLVLTLLLFTAHGDAQSAVNERGDSSRIQSVLPVIAVPVGEDIHDVELADHSERALHAVLAARRAHFPLWPAHVDSRLLSPDGLFKSLVKPLSRALLPELSGTLSSVGGTSDEPTGTVYLPTNPAESCPGFFVLRTHAGNNSKSGRFGAELTLQGSGLRTLQGGLNFGGRATSSVRGFSAFSIANATGESQVVNIGVSVGAPGRLILERRSGGNVVATPIDQTIPSGESSVSTTVPPGFYVLGYTPSTSASTRYAGSALTSYTDRPGGGFQGGVVVGGYHDPDRASGAAESTGFAGFCIANPFDVDVAVLSSPTYGSSGARGMAFSVSSGDGFVYLESREVFQDCPDCPEMVVIPGGSFVMGSPASEPQSWSSERPQRTVNVPAFAMGAYEVTFDQWDTCVADGGCSHNPQDHHGRGSHPVIDVNWNDAQEYVTWLSNKTGLDYRLPSEAEWEYATRAGTSGRFNTGDCITTAQANFWGAHPLHPAQGCPTGNVQGGTLPVGSFAPNPFGLFDTHGNVWEWVQDCWNADYIGAPTDGSAWMAGNCDRTVMRGGSWFDGGQEARSAKRQSASRADRGIGNTGFRVARPATL